MYRPLRRLLKWMLVYPLMSFFCLEIAFLLLGYRPWQNEDYSIRANPPDAFTGHSTLGLQNNPGEYHIQVNDSLSFTSVHLPNRNRAVPGGDSAGQDLVLLGCSFTYGFGVDGKETFAARMQEAFPALSVTNKAVPGYGTVQSFLQLEELLQHRNPEMVLLVFSSYHLMRNTLSPTYRKNLTTGYKRSSKNVANLMETARFPYRKNCLSPIQYASWDSLYKDWPARQYLASVNWFQTLGDRYNEDVQGQIEVTACLIKEMHTRSKNEKIPFAVVCLDTTEATAKLQQQVPDIPWLDVGFDFAKKEWVNLPYDSHPSAGGHAIIASKLIPFIKNLRHAQ